MLKQTKTDGDKHNLKENPAEESPRINLSREMWAEAQQLNSVLKE